MLIFKIKNTITRDSIIVLGQRTNTLRTKYQIEQFTVQSKAFLQRKTKIEAQEQTASSCNQYKSKVLYDVITLILYNVQ